MTGSVSYPDVQAKKLNANGAAGGLVGTAYRLKVAASRSTSASRKEAVSEGVRLASRFAMPAVVLGDGL